MAGLNGPSCLPGTKLQLSKWRDFAGRLPATSPAKLPSSSQAALGQRPRQRCEMCRLQEGFVKWGRLGQPCQIMAGFELGVHFVRLVWRAECGGKSRAQTLTCRLNFRKRDFSECDRCEWQSMQPFNNMVFQLVSDKQAGKLNSLVKDAAYWSYSIFDPWLLRWAVCIFVDVLMYWFSIDVHSAPKLLHIMQKCRAVALGFGSAVGLLAQLVTAMLPVMESIQSKLQDPVFSLDGSTPVTILPYFGE